MSAVIAATSLAPLPETFDRWATSYNGEPNPFLSLEARVLKSLLPPMRCLPVLDAGCGSGRHFSLFSQRGAATIHGVDFSPRMLGLAATVAPEHTRLHRASCDAIPLDDASIDVAVCSLVLGYLASPFAFFREMRRLLRSDGTLLVTDIHPGTALRRGWRRSFADTGQTHSIQWNRYTLLEIREAAKQAGFHIAADLGLPFAEPERDLFASVGRRSHFEDLQQDPALYALVLRSEPTTSNLTLTGARCALSASDAPAASLTIDADRITGINIEDHDNTESIDLSGYLLLPGLINAHDHLEFGLFPQLFKGPYQDAAQWAADIHKRFASRIAAHRAIPHSTRTRFGALRNLLCGVTTVAHHNPVTGNMLRPDFPISVLEPFRWAHSPSFDRAGLEHEASFPQSQEPFLLHAGEGINQHAKNELNILRKLSLLRASTVIVHGLAAESSFLNDCSAQNVAFVTCPSSNQNLFATTPTQELVASYPRAALGSDSPLTACGDLLDELRFTAQHYNIPSNRLYSLVINNAAEILRLRNGEAHLAPGSSADFIAVPDRGLSPADTLRSLSWKDVRLVIRRGRVELLSADLLPCFPANLLHSFTHIRVDGHSRWIRGQWKDDFRNAEPVMTNGLLRLGRRRLALA